MRHDHAVHDDDTTNDRPAVTAPRRGFLLGAGLAAGAAVASRVLPAQAAAADDSLLKMQQQGANSRSRILLKGGMVLSVDPNVGDFARGDVLIQGKYIAAVGPNIEASSALTIDATDMIVMPGLVDTHHHQYEDALRSILSDGLLRSTPDMPVSYTSLIQGAFTPVYTPEDCYICELVASLSQLSAGVTTTVDTSQVNNTPQHTDALIAGLRASGRRAVFAYSSGVGPQAQFPQDITRLRQQYFSSSDQLLTLALGTGVNTTQWALARSVGAPIVSHIVGPGSNVADQLRAAAQAGAMGPDNEYIHCTELPDDVWQLIASTGGKVSIAPAIEMQMRHGLPPFQNALDRKIPLSISVDVECNMTADLFSIMRTAFTLQRALVNERVLQGDTNAPPLLTCYDTIRLATMGGATVAHLDSKVGSLTPGKEADIIMLATDRINTFPVNNVPGTVVTLMDTSNVENVFVAGQPRKWRGQLVGVDLASVRRAIEYSRDGILARANYTPNLFGSCCQAHSALGN